MSELTFNQFRTANVSRCVKWHPQGIDSWSPSDWLTAVTGELGELASLLKMRNRERAKDALILQMSQGRDVLAQRVEDLEAAVVMAYGYLWCVNNEPGAPNQYSPERAAHEARKHLRHLLTIEQRGQGIESVLQIVHPALKENQT